MNVPSEYEAWIAREAQHMQRLVQRFKHAMDTPITQQTEERLRKVTDDGVEVWDVVEQVLDSDGRPMVRWYWKHVRRHGEDVHVFTESAGRLFRFPRPVPLMTFWGMPIVGQWKDVEVAAGTKIAEPNPDPATWQNYWAWDAAFELVYSAS